MRNHIKKGAALSNPKGKGFHPFKPEGQYML